MPKIRVLVVDDAVVMRRLLTEVLQHDPMLELAGTAPNGRIAIQKIAQLAPDIVTLDVEMPEMDGLATLREIRRTHPRLPVIMFSAVTQRGATATLDALAAGATDYVTKPSEMTDLQEAIARLEAELLPRVRAHCPRQAVSGVTAHPFVARGPAATVRPGGSAAPIELLCVATSTGGPNALVDLFRDMTAPLAVPVAIVQHMPPMFTEMLAKRLDSLGTPLRCREARDGDAFEPGVALLAPGGRHMEVVREGGRFVARITDAPPENSCRPAADVMLRTAAATGAGVLAVVLTGMGQDGLRGCEHVVERRGQVIAQDQASSVVWGMPGAVSHAGLAHAVLPLRQIGAEVLRRLNLCAPLHAR